MRQAPSIAAMREIVRGARQRGDRLGFVPTMGALHEGHLRLVDEARRQAALVVMSIFVNPLQFGEGEDFSRYPRDPEGDARLAAARGVDVLFTPTAAEMYRHDRAVDVVPRALAARWEGAARPGHFTGVLTVVAKLFNIVQPDVAVFGRKDVQQAMLVRAMVRDLDIPVEVIVAPTVRDADGLAMSSRNRHLSAEERERALAIPRALRRVLEAWHRGEHAVRRLEEAAQAEFTADGIVPEYLAFMSPDTLEPVERAVGGTIVAVAARVGSTRLIDNLILGSE